MFTLVHAILNRFGSSTTTTTRNTVADHDCPEFDNSILYDNAHTFHLNGHYILRIDGFIKVYTKEDNDFTCIFGRDFPTCAERVARELWTGRTTIDTLINNPEQLEEQLQPPASRLKRLP